MQSAPDESVDLRQYWWMVRRRRWLLVTAIVVAMAMGAIVLQRATPVYSSTTTIKYEPPRSQMVNFSDLSEKPGATDEFQTQLEIIRSPRVVRRVIDALGLAALPEAETAAAPDQGFSAITWLMQQKNKFSRQLVSFDIQPLDPEVARQQRLYDGLLSSVAVQRIDDTRIIRITVSHSNRDKAAALANEFAQQYVLSLQEEGRSTYRDASLWFEQQLSDAKANLEAAERKLHDYKGTGDINVLEQNFEIAQTTMKGLNTDIESSLNDVAALAARQKAAQNEKLRRALLAGDTRFASIITSLETKELERVALIAENTESHPAVIKADRELTILRRQLESAAEDLVAELSAKMDIAHINEDSLRERLKKQEALVEQIQGEMIAYRVLERDVESTRQIYNSLLDRSKQIAVTQDIAVASVTVLRPAEVSEYPSSPKIMRTLAIFGLLGFFGGLGLVFAAEKLDRSIKDSSEVEARLQLPTLGLIPHMKDGGLLNRRKTHSPLLTSFDPKSPEAESFRVLRTSLQYSIAGKPPQMLLVTSSFPQEGKSTVAANLAISFAQRGDRVLLIDCDLKRPAMHRIFDIPRAPGLSDVLTGQKSFDDARLDSPVERLSLLPAGPTTPSPGDLLESPTMNDLLTTLRGRYDTIILDSAPLSGIADSLVLSHSADGICLVVSRGRTPIDGLARVVAQLDQIEAPILGVIYNTREKRAGNHPDASKGGYGYYYYGVKTQE